jgi:hypothetical protein
LSVPVVSVNLAPSIPAAFAYWANTSSASSLTLVIWEIPLVPKPESSKRARAASTSFWANFAVVAIISSLYLEFYTVLLSAKAFVTNCLFNA